MSLGAGEELEGLPRKVRRRLIARIRKLAAEPVPEDSERLSGAGKYRVRHEGYRVVYLVDQAAGKVVVARVGRRSVPVP